MKGSAKRVNFVSIHNSSAVAANGYDALPYKTGLDDVIGGRVNGIFVVTAEDDGRVIAVTDNYLTVEYKKTKEQKTYELGVYHGIVAGVTIPHTRITDMKVNQEFIKGEALIFNSGFFKRSELSPANVTYKHGVISKVALLESSETYEDGCAISSELSEKLYTPNTKVFGIIVDFDKAITGLVKVGDSVDPDSILCTIQEAAFEDVGKDTKALAALQQLSNTSPRANVYGTITRIEVVYHGKLSEMSLSLQKIATTYDTKRNKRVTQLGISDAKTGQIDETIRVNGKKLLANQMAISVYIDGQLGFGTGDKLEFGFQLKSTCSAVLTDPMVAKDGTVIDAKFGYQSLSDRIVESPFYMGIMNEVMIQLTKKMRERYVQ